MADTAHRLTDEKLEEMEKRLSAIYSRTEKTVQNRHFWQEEPPGTLVKKLVIQKKPERSTLKFPGSISRMQTRKLS